MDESDCEWEFGHYIEWSAQRPSSVSQNFALRIEIKIFHLWCFIRTSSLTNTA